MDTAVAGGMENMDRAPYLMYGGRWGYRMGNAQIYDAMLQDGLNDAFSGEHSGWHTEDLVTSTRSHATRRTLGAALAAALLRGSSGRQIRRRNHSCEVKSRKGPQAFAKDEHNRPDTTAESLAKLKPPFVRTAPSRPVTRQVSTARPPP